MSASSQPSCPRSVGVISTGAALPERVMSNADLEKFVDTTDEWIHSRTGIRERRIAGPGETASTMGARAACQALETAGVSPAQIGLIIVATSTPDMIFPSTACLVQNAIGATKAFCFDLSAACSGFLYAMETARQYIANGAVEYALVIGSEKLSCVVDWKDRSPCVLFGDGAGAALLGPALAGKGILGSVFGSDGSLGELLRIPAGGSLNPPTAETVEQRLHYLKMEGRDVFKHAVTNMARSARAVLEHCRLDIGDVAVIIPHQANQRIVQAIAKALDASLDHFFINLEKYGNTSAASVILALHEAQAQGRVKPGDKVLLVVFGAGFTWGASLVEWL